MHDQNIANALSEALPESFQPHIPTLAGLIAAALAGQKPTVYEPELLALLQNLPPSTRLEMPDSSITVDRVEGQGIAVGHEATAQAATGNYIAQAADGSVALVINVVTTGTIPLPPPVLPPPWTMPEQRFNPQAWWCWLHQNQRVVRPGVVGFVVLCLATAALMQWPPFHPRQGWKALGSKLSISALALEQVSGVLLLGSATDFTGCSPDKRIWRSADGGQSWEAIDAPTAMEEGSCPKRAAIRAFAHSPAASLRIYAATSHVGLLRSGGSPEIGLGWNDVTTNSLPSQLRNVVVMPDDADQLLVAAEPDNGTLFHSSDGGESWRQIDGQATCLDPALGTNLSQNIDIKHAMLATRDAVYVGTHGASDTAAPDNAGLYVSTDNGNCWRLLQDGSQRYRYLGLAEKHGFDAVIALTYDFQGHDGEQYQLWEIDRLGGERLLWQTGRRMSAVYTDARTQETWYVANSMGTLLEGSFGSSPQQRPEELAWITHCILICNVALATDPDTENPSAPLLLARDQVYRLDQVPWYRAFWP